MSLQRGRDLRTAEDIGDPYRSVGERSDRDGDARSQMSRNGAASTAKPHSTHPTRD
jgi:hypothetical protein